MDHAGRSGSSTAGSNNPHSLSEALASSASTVPERTPSRTSTRGTVSHRQSFAENLRTPPSPSPRARRHPSLTQQALQDLVNHPPPQRQANPRFVGRDWQDISLGELLTESDVKWAEWDTSVEECTKTLLRNNPSGVLLIRNSPTDKTAVATFDHSDLNAYLLVVIGLARPEPANVVVYDSIARRANALVDIPVRDIQPICHKDPIMTLPASQSLPSAIELFGSGVHRILVTSSTTASPEVVGVLSQLRLLEFFWNERVSFPPIERLYSSVLRDLRIGSQDAISINADRPLAEALSLMNEEGLTSVAVVDNGLNVVGNISASDVEHLTSRNSLPLLKSSCMHFISIILSERGVEEGRDSFPVFFVSTHSTLAHTVAKLVATRSHRMWLVDAPSPSASAPQTPLFPPSAMSTVMSGSIIPNRSRSTSMSSNAATESAVSGSAVLDTNTAMAASTTTAGTGAGSTTAAAPHSHNGSSAVSVPASALPGVHLSGRLTGVVSLTDILNLFAKTTGLRPSDLADIRARRRRSSSSSVRPSIDGYRPSLESLRR